ncbi:MAG: hypothetical protein VKI81_03690 [Synechococcaceae cyanobacterium]|nr:hypothetical protein [Synechococcaceae cyanobacterium]
MPASPRPSKARSDREGAAGRPGAEEFGLRQRLQLLAGFLVPLLAIGLWLNSRGFFASP